MATIFTQDAVLHFLQNHGGSVKNSDLLLHFRIFIRNHADQDRNRELFKKYVNSVATVKQQEGVSYVVLRKKFRGHIQDDVGEVFNMTARLSAPQSSESGRTGRTEEQRLKPQLSYAATAAASEKTPAQIMPVAGIVINNIIQTKLNPKQSQQRVNSAPNPSGGLAAVQVVSQVSEKTDRESNLSKPVVQDRRSTVAQHGVGVGLHPAVTPGISTGRHYWEDREQVSVCHSSGGREVCQQYEAGPGQETPLSPQFAPRCFRYRQSYKSAISYDEDDKVTISAPLGDTGRTISTSLPCIIDTLAPPLVVSASYSPSERNIPKIHIQDVEEKVQPLCYPDWGFESEASHKYIIPHNHQKSHVLGTQLKPRQDLHQPQRSSLSLSHSSKLSPSCDAGFYNSDRPPSCSSKGSEWNSSSISPQANAGELYDDHEEVESSEGSTWAPVLWQRPTVTRRVSSHLRNRMCRSLGADLDQLLQEEARGGSEAARLNRLHLISSSLSLPYNLSSSSLSSCSTPPQYCSLADLDDEKGGRRIITAVTSSTTHYEESGRQSLVPLEPREHSWLVKGAAGAWTDVYSLFREDSSLLNKHDFISGFTVLHWIAKHGDHRVLNTLWYGAQKAGLMFDINARSTCGHTPLHIAAIHGNKNIMRLLVNKFNADVRLRDMAGKKPWQYLNYHMPVDILQLLGAPTRAPVGGVRRVDVSWENQQHQQCKQRNRRQLHHFSSTSSGESRLTIAGTTKVKRSLSIAAFLKRKPVNQFHGDQFEP